MIRYDETSGKKEKTQKKYIQSFKLKENKLFNELKIKSRKKNEIQTNIMQIILINIIRCETLLQFLWSVFCP